MHSQSLDALDLVHLRADGPSWSLAVLLCVCVCVYVCVCGVRVCVCICVTQ